MNTSLRTMLKSGAAAGMAAALTAIPATADDWNQVWMASPEAVWSDTTVFETGLPARYYIPEADVKARLSPSDRKTACPYKGVASYWNVEAAGETHEDLVWAYLDPVREAEPVRGLMCFFNEKVDVVIDGQLQDRPETKWSR